ncbi:MULTISPECIES: carboxypeptidase regulatory-like domain-containing protein [Chitinophagaceae]|uniref:carboxypeptidase regulatory-like domain-containing protein n=1 Tax=Chitinophagaceae TaxID=563835 RepID=UPI000DF00B81|nr:MULTISPECIES: carboxypeptidase regulatory-like domain-containing protein [Chitinophagaceae]RPD46668.1 carboxypeptidase regulatory-like domain-containing protein [Paracnuella aquatica]
MKNILKSTTALALASVALFSFKNDFASGIKGSVTPAESVGTVWAITGTDSLKATANSGAFSFDEVKPGTYQVVVEAKAPYKNLVKEGVVVKEGETTDLGALTLEQ